MSLKTYFPSTITMIYSSQIDGESPGRRMTKMKKRFFALSTNGVDMGIFQAGGPYDALDEQARDAGYASKEDADQRIIADGGVPAKMDIEEISADEASRIEDLISKGYTQCQALDEVREGGDMPTLRDQLDAKTEDIGFWEAVQHFVNAGWDYSDFNAAGYREMCESFDNTFEENLTYLRDMLLSPRHKNISAFFEAMRGTLKDPTLLDSEAGRKEWVKDLETALATTGGNNYEIPARLTKSGNAELYTIRREWFTAPDGEEDYLIVH